MIELSSLLPSIPDAFKLPLFSHFREIASNFVERKWEPAELNGGKFCEVVYSILDGHLRGDFPSAPSKPQNFLDSCRRLEKHAPNTSRVGDKSLRILIPQVLIPLYHVRNHRGVGHVSAEINPNFLDASAVYSMSSWTLAELVRIFHNTTTEIAQQSVDALTERKIPLIWKIGENKRVLDDTMSASDKALALLYSEPGWTTVSNLVSWTKYSNAGMFRKTVLRKLDKSTLIEFDEENDSAHISPTGNKYVETKLLKTRLT